MKQPGLKKKNLSSSDSVKSFEICTSNCTQKAEI